MRRSSLLLCLVVPALVAFGQSAPSASPVGRWRTIDDATGRVKSIVVLFEEHGKLYGKIEKALDRKEPDPKCDACEGELKGQPLTGMRFLWDMKNSGGQWSGGRVLDPHNGKFYRCNLSVEEGGKKLKVRGYIGFSLFGRTQYWLREPSLNQ